MPQIPVTYRELSTPTSKADVPCTNHGNAMNCPVDPCPGVVAPNRANVESGVNINRAVLDKRIMDAIQEFQRLTGLECIAEVADNGPGVSRRGIEARSNMVPLDDEGVEYDGGLMPGDADR